MSKSASLSFENITFSFGKNIIVSDFSLDVKKGSFTTLLGPSGCGKTTLLRLVSGFLEPSEGSIKIDGINQNKLPPEAREIGMVFQDYALFPHMTVEKNLFYGLGIKNNKKEDKEKNIALIHKTARVLGIYNLLDRFPHELSGGQQQRVALGRAIVLEPKILLMDEPLSSLDAKLRTQVREELQEIQKNLGITTLYVTHDQEEALSLSDTIAVINHGKLLQTGSPREIYFNPANSFVADFVGRANFLKKDGKDIIVRPEWINLEKVLNFSEDNNELYGTIISSAFLGTVTRYRIRSNDGSANIIIADENNRLDEIPVGTKVRIIINRYNISSVENNT